MRNPREGVKDCHECPLLHRMGNPTGPAVFVCLHDENPPELQIGRPVVPMGMPEGCKLRDGQYIVRAYHTLRNYGGH